jgi:esterase/lipase
LIFELLKQNYLNERKDYLNTLKPKEIGMPSLNLIGENGVLLCHGFKSSPREMDKLEKFFNQNGFSTYSMRLKGHGTSPENLKKQNFDDWILSHSFASEAMFRLFKKVFVCGFSMGGLISLINATKFSYNGVMSISAPLSISNYKFYFAGIMNEFTSFVKLLHKNVQDFVVINPEHPDINYKKTYFKSLKDLNSIIKMTRKVLKTITLPALIIQGMNDNIVDPKSAQEIYTELSSLQKEIYEYKNKAGHVIVLEEENEELLNKILTFIQKF